MVYTARQHGMWNYDCEIPSVYIQLGVCGEYNTVKVYYRCKFQFRVMAVGKCLCSCVKMGVVGCWLGCLYSHNAKYVRWEAIGGLDVCVLTAAKCADVDASTFTNVKYMLK